MDQTPTKFVTDFVTGDIPRGLSQPFDETRAIIIILLSFKTSSCHIEAIAILSPVGSVRQFSTFEK